VPVQHVTAVPTATDSRINPRRWLVLTRRPMAGFEVTTEVDGSQVDDLSPSTVFANFQMTSAFSQRPKIEKSTK